MKGTPAGSLLAWEVNAESEFQSFIAVRKKELLSILEQASIFSREEIAPFLDLTLPGMAEISALLAIENTLASGKYSHIVVDTAPFGHTLRLFELPAYFERFLGFLELAAGRDRVLAEHFGGKRLTGPSLLLRDWRRALLLIQTALRDRGQLILVTTTEKFALNESRRCAAVLQKSSFEVSGIVLNRAVVRGGNCSVCRQKANATAVAKQILKTAFPSAYLHVAEDSGAPVVGIKGLTNFAEHVFSGKSFAWAQPVPQTNSPLVRCSWPKLAAPLAFVVGKGGVGKTTISAALGFHSRAHEKARVDICSVDPAPSLDDVFQTDVVDEFRPVLGDLKFRAAEIDAAAEFQEWSRRMKQMVGGSTSSGSSGIHVDLWFERQLFEQLLDSVPPGVDEVLSVFRIQQMFSDRKGKLIIDMAPTGHALELLRTPQRLVAWSRLLLKTLAAERKLAFVQDAAIEIAAMGRRSRALFEVLQDGKRSLVYVVMLAESLPDRETERLMRELKSLRLPIGPLFVNRVVFPQDAGKCRRCRRASQWQMGTLFKLRERYPETQVLIARNFPQEIAGKARLRSFAGELWCLG